VTTRIFAVEDHAIMRAMLVEFLTLEPGWEVSGVASSGEQALAALDEDTASPPSLVLVDVSLPGMTGIEFVRRFNRRAGRPPCVMLSGHHDPSYARHAEAAGAYGYVVKGNPEELVRAIRTVLTGRRYVGAAEPAELEVL
jgi:DNA-binding NarL/FixJ family response regulator